MTRKLLFLVTEDWYFCSHRIDLARAAKAAGYAVTVVTQVKNHRSVIEAEGFRLIPIVFPRSWRRPWQDISTLFSIAGIYRKESPDIIHQVALKAVVYGSFINGLLHYDQPRPVIINALTGMGFVFTSDSPAARLLRWLVEKFLRYLMRRERTHLIVQNHEDMEMLVAHQIVRREQISLIRGSGVNVEEYRPHPPIPGIPVVILVARMLSDKGIYEFVAAAQMLQEEGVQARFVLIGDTDPENPSSISEAQLRDWHESGCIEWWGRRDDMREVYQHATIAVLPSYREGLPKVLLEAAACGLPLIATDVPGCREIVQDGINGIRVALKDKFGLANAIRTLLNDPELRKRMGEAGRQLVEQEFSSGRVIQETLSLYNDMLNASPNRQP